jgi:hypothetical protein
MKGIDIEPTKSLKRLSFDMDRTWASNVDGAFLAQYAQLQKEKKEPTVFANEAPSTARDVGLKKDAEYVKWFKEWRERYYRDEGRLGRLRVLELTKNWPNYFGIQTKAPFIRCTEKPYAPSPANEELPVFKAFAIPEIAQSIIQHLAPSSPSLAKFGRTCHRAFDVVSHNVVSADLPVCLERRC